VAGKGSQDKLAVYTGKGDQEMLAPRGKDPCSGPDVFKANLHVPEQPFELIFPDLGETGPQALIDPERLGLHLAALGLLDAGQEFFVLSLDGHERISFLKRSAALPTGGTRFGAET
jgi:hypothetical protein